VLKASTERIWAELPAVYAELGLPVNDSDPALRRLGTCFFKVRVRLGAEPRSSYLDCGEINT